MYRRAPARLLAPYVVQLARRPSPSAASQSSAAAACRCRASSRRTPAAPARPTSPVASASPFVVRPGESLSQRVSRGQSLDPIEIAHRRDQARRAGRRAAIASQLCDQFVDPRPVDGRVNEDQLIVGRARGQSKAGGRWWPDRRRSPAAASIPARSRLFVCFGMHDQHPAHAATEPRKIPMPSARGSNRRTARWGFNRTIDSRAAKRSRRSGDCTARTSGPARPPRYSNSSAVPMSPRIWAAAVAAGGCALAIASTSTS